MNGWRRKGGSVELNDLRGRLRWAAQNAGNLGAALQVVGKAYHITPYWLPTGDTANAVSVTSRGEAFLAEVVPTTAKLGRTTPARTVMLQDEQGRVIPAPPDWPHMVTGPVAP